jgi:hypothetical protein
MTSHPDAAAYGPLFASLLAEPRLLPLITARPHEAARESLEAMTLEAAFAHHRIADRAMGRCCLAAVWLYHDFAEASHAISQEIETPTGSYWHAILHRREPDYDNAKYWFRRVGHHSIFKSLHLEAAQLAAQHETADVKFLRRGGDWDAYAFVDFVEEVVGSGTPIELLALQVQRAEWWRLFDHSYRHAIGT